MTNARLRYQQSHRLHQDRTAPAMVRDHGYIGTKFPDTRKANGLQTFILNFLTWNGWRATRINVSGRLIERPEKQASGIILGTKRYMHSATRKGSADISATIAGKSVMLEVKAGRDKPRPDQIEEQTRERRAGGVYEFIYSVEQFLTFYDNFIAANPVQSSIFT